MKRIHVYFSGQVQGVGFRFVAEKIGLDLGLAGWVKNLADGRVELVAEASQQELDNLLDQIKQYFKNYISDIEVDYSLATGEFKNFGIRFFL